MQTTEFNKLQSGLGWVGVLIFLNLILYIAALNFILVFSAHTFSICKF